MYWFETINILFINLNNMLNNFNNNANLLNSAMPKITIDELKKTPREKLQNPLTRN